MEVTLFNNGFYELSYDSFNNQIYWVVKGYWPSVAVVPDMEQDWADILARAKKPGFNILADLTTMKAPPLEVNELHSKVQKQIIDEGVHKIATLINTPTVKLAVQNIGRVSGMDQLISSFDSEKKAQSWLNEK